MSSYSTKFEILSKETDLQKSPADVLLIPVFQAETNKKTEKASSDAEEKAPEMTWTSLLSQLDTALDGHLKEAVDAEAFSGKAGQCRIFKSRPADKIKARWVILVGMGTPSKLKMKKAIGAIASGLKATYDFKEANHAIVVLPKQLAGNQFLQSIVFGALQSTYKTQEADEKKVHALKTVSIYPEEGQSIPKDELAMANSMGLAESYTKDLANKPANIKTADLLAQSALAMKGLSGVTVEVIADNERIKTEMPAFWAVAQGAAHVDPPRFIKINYRPKGTIKKKIALVGKGVIFDTGGVQVKPGESMNDMKFDMTGAASVMAAVKAAAEMALKGVEVTAYVAAAQNLTGEEAYLPDSIIASASGKKIEVRHTDAEGRVTLADAVYKAVQDAPDEMITIATLTGAASIAVGHCIALMGTDDGLLDRVEQAARSVGETVQKLELLEEDFEAVKSDRDAADLSNTGKGRERGHLKAGAFVISFAEDIPIAHLDIAGGDAKDGNATGIAVKGLIQYLRNASA